MKRQVLILAKSYKNKGYCVAGVDAVTGAWVRLVSNDSGGALDKYGVIGVNDDLLHILQVEELGPRPLPYHPENILIRDSSARIDSVKYTIADALKLHPAENYPYLYGNTQPYIDEETIRGIGYSLVLVEVSDLVLTYRSTHNDNIKPSASFVYNGKRYQGISVTDPKYDYDPAQREIRHARAHLVVSLPSTPFPEGCYYKFVAAIYPKEG